jgi:two-component system response regulator MprA
MELPRRALTVLVVDEDASLRELLRAVLEDAGYSVLVAADGAQALDVVKTDRPDAMLLDVGMPVMNGVEFVRAYRRLVEPPHAPIVISSARGDAEHVARDLDADGSINKPFAIDDVLAVLERVVERRDQQAHAHDYRNEDSLREGSEYRRI